MKRVEVTKPFVGLIAMQVCAVKDATDEEILEVCNRENPSGTSNGWTEVIHGPDEIFGPNCGPVVCKEDDNRIHYLVTC